MGGRARVSGSPRTRSAMSLSQSYGGARNLIGNGGGHKQRLLLVIEAVKIGNSWNAVKDVNNGPENTQEID